MDFCPETGESGIVPEMKHGGRWTYSFSGIRHWRMIIIETAVFTRQIRTLLDDDAYARFQVELIRDPTAGDLIPGGGGIRKVRVSLAGRGKRGGARVIYFWMVDESRILMLLAYAKSERTGLSPMQAAILKRLIKELR
jgi:hypothetical protein